jgi:uncharacterized damage-inducible protein DinB
MNAAAIRVLFDYNAWAHALLWNGIKQLTEDQFTQDLNYSLGSIRNHMVHLASVDARWFARVRGVRLPDRLDGDDFQTREDVSRLWSVIYNDIDLYLQHLSDATVTETLSYSARGEARETAKWQILLHVINHGTDHRAQVMHLLHKLGAPTAEQDFVYYLRDELPPRGHISVDPAMIRKLFEYDAYATSRLVSECMAELTEAQLDHSFGYSHDTVRAQLAHLMMGGQYWLERAFDREIPGNVSSVFSAAALLTRDTTEAQLLEPVEYTTGANVEAANIRWEMLWHLVNHGTDHRAQTLAFLHELGTPTFEQDMMIYFWDYDIDV